MNLNADLPLIDSTEFEHDDGTDIRMSRDQGEIPADDGFDGDEWVPLGVVADGEGYEVTVDVPADALHDDGTGLQPFEPDPPEHDEDWILANSDPIPPTFNRVEHRVETLTVYEIANGPAQEGLGTRKAGGAWQPTSMEVTVVDGALAFVRLSGRAILRDGSLGQRRGWKSWNKWQVRELPDWLKPMVEHIPRARRQDEEE
jgi:hypothetical protein